LKKVSLAARSFVLECALVSRSDTVWFHVKGSSRWAAKLA
jgi:hypothetical protein